tara:strand:+ start:478 stop:669 length:192 start_codon:yes stop_codon:yes gene_type:complete
MQVGALIKSSYDSEMSPRGIRKGVIIETDINMWGEDVIPSGVRVMWSNDEIETVYADEVEAVK